MIVGHMTCRWIVAGSCSVVGRSSGVVSRWTCVGGWRGSDLLLLLLLLLLAPVDVTGPIVRIRGWCWWCWWWWIVRRMMRAAPRRRRIARRRGVGGARGMG